MSRGVNRVTLIGNVGNDPETRHMPSGNAVTNLSLATSEAWKDKQSGQKQERTEWHRVVFFGKLAEIVAQYVQKGSKLYIEGSLRTRSWEQDGIKRYATEIVGSEFQFVGGNEQGQSRQSAPQQSAPPVQANTGPDSFDDDIPFLPFLKGMEHLV